MRFRTRLPHNGLHTECSGEGAGTEMPPTVSGLARQDPRTRTAGKFQQYGLTAISYSEVDEDRHKGLRAGGPRAH